MIQVIVGLILFFLALGLAIKMAKILWKCFLWLLGGCGVILFGPAALVGYLCFLMLRALKLEALGIFSVSVVGVILPCVFAYFATGDYLDVINMEYGKYFLASPLFALCIPALRGLKAVEDKVYDVEFMKEKRTEVYSLYFMGISFLLLSVVSWYEYLPSSIGESVADRVADSGVWFEYTYSIVGLFLTLAGYLTARGVSEFVSRCQSTLSAIGQKAYYELEGLVVSKRLFISLEDSKLLFGNVLVKLISDGKLVEFEVANGSTMLINAERYNSIVSSIGQDVEKLSRITLDDLSEIVSARLSLSGKDAVFFSETHMDNGGFHQFDDGKYFVPYNVTNIRCCSSCGKTELLDRESDGEWYCSDICIETENVCDSLKKQDVHDFIESAATTGLVLVAGADAYLENHKLFAVGGQGHGFAAENANNMIDRLKGKDASVIGGDNAKNGADRIVDGELIQTKYYGTAARSVGAGFDGQGDYKYLKPDGQPMALEVPSDQYEKSIEVMREKIKDGRVPGITDPADAEKLIVKGSVTYEQAKNITRFGTVESLTYDIAEGAVVGMSAAGISFGITAATCYLQTKDKSTALRAGIVQGAKAFGKSTTVFVGVQQLHRLDVVQGALKNIDIRHLSPSFKRFIQRGTGTSGTGAANSALRGTVLTSVVVIAVTTGPDLLKLVRGRISTGQFIKNLAVVSTGTIGGVAGSFAGGALLSPLGPAGMLAGRVVGGMVGSAFSTMVAKHLTNKLIADDRDMILTLLIQQVEYLVSIFMLTEKEIENLNENLQLAITQEALENIYSSKKDRIAAANFVVKPIIVGIVKQRPALIYSDADVAAEGADIDRELGYGRVA